MTSDAPVVFAWFTSQWARLHTPLCRYLKQIEGIETVLFTVSDLPNPATVDFDGAAFREVIDLRGNLQLRPSSEIPETPAFSQRIAAFEKETGMLVNDILRTDRHLGIGFVSGADFMRSQFAAGRDYRQNVDLVLRLGDLFRPLLERYRPLCMLGSPGTIGSSTLAAMAAAWGAPLRNFVPSREGSKFVWSDGWVFNAMGFREAFARNLTSVERATGAQDATPPQPLVSLRGQAMVDRFRGMTGVSWLAAALARLVRHRLLPTLLGRRTTGGYGRYAMTAYFSATLERWRWRRRALREPSIGPTLDDDVRFVFFPLHVEPESSLMVEAQMCDDQACLIDWIAKNLPGGWLVVVKEHPGATAPRPVGFWERIRRLPNVLVAATLENGNTLAERAQAVAVINGTLGIQAAMACKSVITFHPEYIGLCMPHVHLARSYEETRRAIRRIADGDVPMQARVQAARAFAKALDDTAFEIRDPELRMGIPGVKAADAADVARLGDTLLESLGIRAREPAPATVAR